VNNAEITRQRRILLKGQEQLVVDIEVEAGQRRTPADSSEERTPDFGDAGVEFVERETSLAIETTLKGEVENVTHALDKITLGTYGVCDGCATEIPLERLQARPQATLCLACQVKQERAGRGGRVPAAETLDSP
jgi:RNA polymerase-binding transcription factor DksA